MQQVGGVAGSSRLVQVAPALDPATIPLPTAPPFPFAIGMVTPKSARRLKLHQRAYGRRLGFAVFATLSGALAFTLLTDGGRQVRNIAPLLPDADHVLSWTGLRIQQVHVTGQRFTSDTEIFDAIDLVSMRSLLGVDTDAARARVEALPWIATASISRVYPGTLDVRVTERKAAAVWLDNGREFLIDEEGRVLSAVRPGTEPDLPRVAGRGAAAPAKALLELVASYPRIRERFALAERVAERRWTLHLKNRVTVHLGVDREAAAFAALSSPGGLGALLAGHDLIIDLRTRGRATVRPSQRGAVAAGVTQS